MTTASPTWPLPAHPAGHAVSFVAAPALAPAPVRTVVGLTPARLTTLLTALLHTLAACAVLAFLLLPLEQAHAGATGSVAGVAHPVATQAAAEVHSLGSPRRAEIAAGGAATADQIARVGARVTAARAALTTTVDGAEPTRLAPVHRAHR